MVMEPGTLRELITLTKGSIREQLDRNHFEHVAVDMEIERAACVSNG
jgi:hypothetical protein